MNKNKVLLYISLVPSVITVIAMLFMKDIVPMHYNLSGKIDRYGSKYENFILPLIILFFYILWVLLIKFYSKSNMDDMSKEKKNLNLLYLIAIICTSLLVVLQCIILVVTFINS